MPHRSQGITSKGLWAAAAAGACVGGGVGAGAIRLLGAMQGRIPAPLVKKLEFMEMKLVEMEVDLQTAMNVDFSVKPDALQVPWGLKVHTDHEVIEIARLSDVILKKLSETIKTVKDVKENLGSGAYTRTSNQYGERSPPANSDVRGRMTYGEAVGGSASGLF